MSWSVAGTYLEACNCDAICPCRTIGGRRGGRSSYGECLGALSWWIEQGALDGVDLAELAVVIASRYSDDEPDSPWSFVLYLDARAPKRQRQALEGIFTGRLGGTAVEHFPWAWKPSELIAVRSAKIEVEHTPGRGWFRAGDEVSVRVAEPFRGDEAVSCVIPGHERDGRELIASELRVDDPPLGFELSGRCGYESTFAYGSSD